MKSKGIFYNYLGHSTIQFALQSEPLNQAKLLQEEVLLILLAVFTLTKPSLGLLRLGNNRRLQLPSSVKL
jgi:hypothetical protein